MPKLFMTEKKIEGLLHLSKPWSRDQALFHIALATGLRASDLLNLKRKDVELDHEVVRTIRIKIQKTGKLIERILPDPCRIAIAQYLRTRTDDNPYLFRSESNNSQKRAGPMNRSSLHRLYKEYLLALFPEEVLRGNACHTTRRSVAKIISDRAGRIEPATRFLGHSSLASTIAYLDMDSYGRQADEIVENLSWNKT